MIWGLGVGQAKVLSTAEKHKLPKDTPPVDSIMHKKQPCFFAILTKAIFAFSLDRLKNMVYNQGAIR